MPRRASGLRRRTSARRGGSQARPRRGVPRSATRCAAGTAQRHATWVGAARHPGGGRRSHPRWCRSVPPAPTEQNRHFVHFIWLVVALRAHLQKYKLQQNGYFVHLGAPRCGAACWWWSVPPGRRAALSAPAWLWAPSGAQAPGRRAEARRCWRVPGSGSRLAGLSACAARRGASRPVPPPTPPRGGALRALSRAQLPARELRRASRRAVWGRPPPARARYSKKGGDGLDPSPPAPLPCAGKGEPVPSGTAVSFQKGGIGVEDTRSNPSYRSGC